MIAFIEFTIQVRNVFVHFILIIMMTEETPNTSICIPNILEIDRTIRITETEICIFSCEETHFTSKGNDIFRIHAVLFVFQRELTNTTQVGMSCDAVVWHPKGNPNSTFSTWTLTDDFHDPSFILIANGKSLTGGFVTIFSY